MALLNIFDIAGSALTAQSKRLNVAAPVPTEDKADFVGMGGGSQAVLLMDPRSEAEDNTASTASTDHPAPR